MRKPIALIPAHMEKFIPLMYFGFIYMFAIGALINPLFLALGFPLVIITFGVPGIVTYIEISGLDLKRKPKESDREIGQELVEGQVNVVLGNCIYAALPILLIAAVSSLNLVVILLVPVVWSILASLVVVVNTVLMRNEQKKQKAIQAEGMSIEMTRLPDKLTAADRRLPSSLINVQDPGMVIGSGNGKGENGASTAGKVSVLSKTN